MGRIIERRDVLKLLAYGGLGVLTVGCRRGQVGNGVRSLAATKTLAPEATKAEIMTETESPTPTLGVTQTEVEAVSVWFERERVEEMYEMEDGKRLEDVEINPEIMKAVEGLGIRADGDITDLLIRVIPVDSELGLRFSESYVPPFEMVRVKNTGILTFAYMDSETLIDVQTAHAIIALQNEAFALGYPVFLAYAYRSRELQRELHEGSMDEYGNSGAAAPGSTEHHTGMAVDLYTSETNKWEPDEGFLALANKYGLVNSIRPGDNPHFFYLDGVWPGLTKALLDAGIDPNNRRNSVDARITVFQILMRLARNQ